MRRCGGGERRAPHYRVPPLHILPRSKRRRLWGELVSHVRGTAETKRGQGDVTKSNAPLISQTGGNPLKSDINND